MNNLMNNLKSGDLLTAGRTTATVCAGFRFGESTGTWPTLSVRVRKSFETKSLDILEAT